VASEAQVPRIPVAEARELQQTGAAVLVDVRDPASFANGHIAGAVHVPLGEITARAGELPRDRRVIAYCS
jgi:rhodanese-related sulfurtransferase